MRAIDTRENILNDFNENKNGEYVIYWMQETQRIRYNYGLNKAIRIANEYNRPLIVIFNYIKNYPEAQKRHFKFMLEGLKEVEINLKKRNIKFIVFSGDLIENLKRIAYNSVCIVMDKGYLRFQREQRRDLIKNIESKLIEVESNVVVPVKVTSLKEEYSAKTIRNKILKHMEKYLKECEEEKYNLKRIYNALEIENVQDIQLLLEEINLDEKLENIYEFKGGEKEAHKKIKYFKENNLKDYLIKGPDKDVTSKISPYLHFGQISPLDIYFQIIESEHIEERKKFIDELVVRRELAFNFVYYNDNYDKWDHITYKWAYETLEKHSSDSKEWQYDKKSLEEAKTHDMYWNKAQRELVQSGYMDGYMRMYWGKKILEWMKTPKEAYEVTIYLNNKYLYDGRDPNSYAGVAWCYGKHDRAWPERKIFGKVRSMTSTGLEKKYKMEKYMKNFL